jgi:hypothetical protein
VLERLLPICVRMENKHVLAAMHMSLGKAYLALDRIEMRSRSSSRLHASASSPAILATRATR